jgi:Na+-transporting NADH:ubiquinone oxidoreductase subunit C
MRQRLFSIAYMFLLTFFFTSVVSAVKLYTEGRINANQRARLQRVVLEVLGIPLKENASAEDLMEVYSARVKSIRAGEKTLYVGYEEDGETVRGYAFDVGGPGFWGPIFGMAAVDPAVSRIMGVAFYRHTETPGLGGRITEAWFTDQFVGLPLSRGQGKGATFRFVPPGMAKRPGELDAITGASGTSRAVEVFLNRELDRIAKILPKAAQGGLRDNARTAE